MHIFFSGIGGAAIGPLALIAKQAGYEVSGSDKQSSSYTEYLQKQGIDTLYIGQTIEQIQKIHDDHPIDLFVYSSAVLLENPDHPELSFCHDRGIRTVKRDELINVILSEKNLQMIAIAGTHGKTTTTAMTIWLFKQLGIPVSYSVGAKIPFGDMGNYDASSKYFVYEADEFDKNFLSFHPKLCIITGIDWDHPDIYPTRENYYAAFEQFIEQSERTVIWEKDSSRLNINESPEIEIVQYSEESKSQLVGKVNRENAVISAHGMSALFGKSTEELIKISDTFPGLSRRFEQIAPNVFSDYAHTPEKIRGAIQIAKETAGDKKITVVYEGLHNTRQHFIKDELVHLFDNVDSLLIVPSYRAREDEDLEDLTPEKLCKIVSKKTPSQPMRFGEELKSTITVNAELGIVLCLSAGGGGSLDEWLHKEFAEKA